MASDWKAETDQAVWSNLRDRKSCSAVGVGIIAAFQIVARNALRAPWTSYDGQHSTRVPIDGTWGPITQAALYTVGKMRALDGLTLDKLKSAGGSKTITLESAKAMVWLSYYSPRNVDLDVGGEKVVRTDPARLGNLSYQQLELPASTVLPVWNIRPSLPGDLDALGSQTPACVELVDPISIGGGTTPNTNTNTNTNTTTTNSSGVGVFAIVVAAGLAIVASKRKKERR